MDFHGRRATDPILHAADVADGTHINVVGSSCAGPAEIDVARAHFFPDHREGVRAQGGEFLRARAAGLVDNKHVLDEIGTIFAGAASGRCGADDVTVYKSLGSIVQDLAAAVYLHRQLKDRSEEPVPLTDGWLYRRACRPQ